MPSLMELNDNTITSINELLTVVWYQLYNQIEKNLHWETNELMKKGVHHVGAARVLMVERLKEQ